MELKRLMQWQRAAEMCLAKKEMRIQKEKIRLLWDENRYSQFHTCMQQDECSQSVWTNKHQLCILKPTASWEQRRNSHKYPSERCVCVCAVALGMRSDKDDGNANEDGTQTIRRWNCFICKQISVVTCVYNGKWKRIRIFLRANQRISKRLHR